MQHCQAKGELSCCACVCVRFVSFRSRLADFQHNCQPSALSASGCVRESRAMCLKAYAGLIGEIEEQEVVTVCSFIVLNAWIPSPVSGEYNLYIATLVLFCHPGTIMTPNYVSNSSTEVSQWCTCDGSGNEWQGCQRILNMFGNNMCLREWNVPHFRVQLQSKQQLFLCKYPSFETVPNPQRLCSHVRGSLKS